MNFTPHIDRVIRWGPTVGGSTGAREVTLRGYAKENTADYPYTVANEFVASRIGHRLGLPLPPGSLVQPSQPSGQPGWVTLAFTLLDPPDVDPSEVVKEVPELAAAVLVFDLLIANQDRHAGNLWLDGRRLDVFDHSHCLFGVEAGGIEEHCNYVQDKFVLDGLHEHGIDWHRHCLLDHIPSKQLILNAIDQFIPLLGDGFLGEVVQAVRKLGVGIDDAAANRLLAFLSYRRENLRSLIKANQGEFGSIPATEWGMT